MKTFVLILVMYTTLLATQNKQSQGNSLPQIATQSVSEVAPNPQTIAQPQPIVFTAEQLADECNKILDRSETFYNNRMNLLLWVMGIIMTAGLAIVGILIPMVLEWYRKRSFTKELAIQSKEFNERLSQADTTLKKSTEERIQKLETELINQIDDSRKATYSNISFLFTALSGLFIPLKMWDMVIRTHLIAIRQSITGQCVYELIKGSHLKNLLENENITNKLKLDDMEDSNEKLEDIKSQLCNITDTEQRVQVESQIKDLQMTVHALIVKKRQAIDSNLSQGRSE